MTPARFALFAACAALVAACDRSRAAPLEGPLPTVTSSGGPDVVLLRIPRAGGTPKSYRWPALDEPVWSGSDRLPAMERVLAFDEGGGLLSFVAEDGRAGRLDLTTGRVQFGAKPLKAATSSDGWSLFGISDEGRLVRSVPAADWRGPPAKPDTIIALPGGFVVLVHHSEDHTRFIKLHPPAVTPADTLEIPRAGAVVRTTAGDRMYAQTDRGVVAVDVRLWRMVPGPRTGRLPLAIAPTPSGDRVFVLDADGRTVRVWDRYFERFGISISLPATANALRMDTFGRFLLARVELSDSAFVISVPMTRVVATLATEWRRDLPTFAPDGSLLTLRGSDVMVMDPATGQRRKRMRAGAADVWTLVRWDGFRPRDSSLDAPVTFETDSPADSALAAERTDSLLAAQAARAGADALDSIARASAVTRRATDDSIATTGYTLSFAALLSESSAHALADRIRVDGRPPRVVASSRDGVTIYRVVLGPYATREAADAAGKRSGVAYWVFYGMP